MAREATDTRLEAILGRRAIRAFEEGQVPTDVRQKLLEAARSAPSSFNIQPYRLYWVESPEQKKEVARLCLGQKAAVTASALVVVAADIGSWKRTAEAHVQWMRRQGFPEEKIADAARKAKLVKWFFIQGWLGSIGAVKWLLLRLVHLGRVIGKAPVTRQGLFQWATKSTSLACQNLMIAAETLRWNSCPMEGFDSARLSRHLKLSRRHHEIVMVIAIGKKSAEHVEQPQWRRPLEETVTIL